MIVVVDKDRGCWIEFCGTRQQAVAKYGLVPVSEIETELGPMSLAAQQRPSNHFETSPQEQWDTDKRLGILDWDGSPIT